jgi:hypothetical protein
VKGPFDHLVDVDCYHALPDGLRDAYAAGVAAVARKDADFYLAGINNPPASWRLLRAGGISLAELHRRFSDFVLEDEETSAGIGAMRHVVLYHLVRKEKGDDSCHVTGPGLCPVVGCARTSGAARPSTWCC